MNFKLLAWIIGPILGLIVVGWVVVTLVGFVLGALSWLLKLALYLALGAAAVGLAVWGFNKMRGKVGGSSANRQIR